MQELNSILSLALSAAPWLLLGLVVAGLIKAWLPESLLQRWMGGQGLASILRAAIIGMPLPLCSCGSIPTALALHRGGAGRGPTTSFLIATPGVGVDSLLLTSVLLGPVMTLARLVGALVTAITTGWLVGRTCEPAAGVQTEAANKSCCSKSGCCDETPAAPPTGTSAKLRQGLVYAFSDLLDDISLWVFAGLLLAGVLVTFLPPETLAGVQGDFWPLLLMALVGIPLYICATAATPLAAGLLLTGISPGMALVFLLAGPVTSLATLGVLRRELGSRALSVYLLSIVSVSVLLGWLLDQLLQFFTWNPVAQATGVQELLPAPLEGIALALLVLMAIKPLRKRLFGF
ncbi:SO_0444 family Cu/Zn efflux transporter [Marinospirillum perlucidum]|uniref:SO_0444 family Cu/Zn efflux transporter n=1 Tax=Marinospirillum perlucidum TaxID=1982602 RepID=UPI001C4996AE|nr:SO_0444 family Cu/Zn efflux transporter [Marinospirillum perlucidum]